MTCTLLVMRHGKSDWTAAVDDDLDRPLNRRGRRAAKTMGRFLQNTGNDPELALTSPARRARDTLQLAAKAGRWRAEVGTAPSLYGHGAADIVHHLRNSLAAEAGRVMIVGHEPNLTETIEVLTGASVRFPTAAVASIDLDITSWRQLSAGTGRLLWLVPPRLLGSVKIN